MPDGITPIEATRGRWRLARPQHPSGEDTVEKSLHQCRAEEGSAALAFKSDAQRLLQCGAHDVEGWCIACCLHSPQTIPGVRCEQLGQVLGLNKRCPMRKCPGEVLTQGCADIVREGPRRLQAGLEVSRRLCQSEGLQLCGLAGRIFAKQHKVTGVSHQNEPVLAPVFTDLIASHRQPGIITGRLDLQHPTLRDLTLARLALLDLLRCIQTDVRVSRTLLRQLADAENFGLKYATHCVQ